MKRRSFTVGLIGIAALLIVALLLTPFVDGSAELSAIGDEDEIAFFALDEAAMTAAAYRHSPQAARWFDAQRDAAAQRIAATMEAAAARYSKDAARLLNANDAPRFVSLEAAAYRHSPQAALWFDAQRDAAAQRITATMEAAAARYSVDAARFVEADSI